MKRKEKIMKKLHLLCNAHLDPVWLWQWKEGCAEGLSTFRVAADFCEKYDGFVFNHNEALIYEWVEEYEPELFERIKKLVKLGKWKIMGGWYLQPDCVMTSGESLLSQIDLGHKYFKEKFGIVPEVAINFDPFGHSRGLVQILNKTGYTGYLFMRPASIYDGDFIWEGFDGSQVLAHRLFGGYNTLKGYAREKVQTILKEKSDKDTYLCLWGIGDHGGGPSKIDLEELNDFINNEKDVEIVHSDCESYFKEVNREGLEVIDKSLIPAMVGCYTSMTDIKKGNRRLENIIAITEKIVSCAKLNGDFEYDKDELIKAKKALAFCQFHDILPGSAIKRVEKDSIMKQNYAQDICEHIYQKAFMSLAKGEKNVIQSQIPVMVFNPHPYKVEGEFEIEFMLENQNWNEGEQTIAHVYDKDGNFIPSQNEKPDCTFSLDWIQKVCFKATLEPMCINRFDCTLEVIKNYKIDDCNVENDCFVIENENNAVKISKKTGKIELYKVNGKNIVEDGGVIGVYKDDEDPWGMNVKSFNNKLDDFKLMSDKEANEFTGYPDEKTPNVRLVENGDVRTKIQAYFKYNRSVAVVEYTIPKTAAYIDVEIVLYSNETMKMIKYELPTSLKTATPYGQTAFGKEELYNNGNECVYHKWCGYENKEDNIYIINDGIYGGSFKDGQINVSLLRTPTYSTHPISDRPYAPHNRFIKHIDMGERIFNFRIQSCDNVEKEANVYNEKPQSISFFPNNTEEKKGSFVILDNEKVSLSGLKEENGEFILHIFNTTDTTQKCTIEISVLNIKEEVVLNKFELRFLKAKKGVLEETKEF